MSGVDLGLPVICGTPVSLTVPRPAASVELPELPVCEALEGYVVPEVPRLVVCGAGGAVDLVVPCPARAGVCPRARGRRGAGAGADGGPCPAPGRGRAAAGRRGGRVRGAGFAAVGPRLGRGRD